MGKADSLNHPPFLISINAGNIQRKNETVRTVPASRLRDSCRQAYFRKVHLHARQIFFLSPVLYYGKRLTPQNCRTNQTGTVGTVEEKQ